MATIALPRPIAPHRSSSGIVTLTAPISLETINAQQVPCALPVPNKHIPSCPTGPPPSSSQEVHAPLTPPESEDESRPPSLLYPPKKYTRLELGSLTIYSIGARDVAKALDHIAREPLPDPSQVFPWFHGLHPNNQIQQAFFIARRKTLRKTPSCLRGITVVKADGDLGVSRLKGAIAPEEFLEPGASGEFVDPDPKEGFSVRNFQIQAAKAATTSDIIVYGDDAAQVRKLGWEIAAAQAKWRERHESQGHAVPEYNTFVCVNAFRDFEERHGDMVAVDSEGRLTGAVVDLFHQERAEMYAMSRASEISHNVFLGPTPEPGDDEEKDYDVLIECSDLGRLNPAALQAIAEDRDDSGRGRGKRAYFDFPSSGSILPPTWSHAEADGILETCKWIWHLSHGTHPSEPAAVDAEGDSQMSDSTDSDDTSEGRRGRRRRQRKILIHCADGYTESTMLGIAYSSYSMGRSVPEAWLRLHTEAGRNFFAYPTDVALLTALSARLLHESPACAARGLGFAEITALAREEPRWLAGLDGSFPSRVLDYMYLGNIGHANNPDLLRALGIRQILSVGETAMWRDGELDEWGEENVYVVQGVQDNGIDPLTDEFEKCLDFIGTSSCDDECSLSFSPLPTPLFYSSAPSLSISSFFAHPRPLECGSTLWIQTD